jgi:hypothetical protein
VLTRRAAAEVVSRDQDLGFAIGRLVEHEIRIFAAIIPVALLGEKALAEPGALDRLQILLWDHHVGVDIDDIQRRGDAFEGGKFFHGFLRRHLQASLERFCFIKRPVFWSIAGSTLESRYAYFDDHATCGSWVLNRSKGIQ